eukprot:SAG31_NODE_29_length_32663_cov_14.779695_14_plen_169_part_00
MRFRILDRLNGLFLQERLARQHGRSQLQTLRIQPCSQERQMILLLMVWQNGISGPRVLTLSALRLVAAAQQRDQSHAWIKITRQQMNPIVQGFTNHLPPRVATTDHALSVLQFQCVFKIHLRVHRVLVLPLMIIQRASKFSCSATCVFTTTLTHRRCLMLMSDFVEWI